MEPSAPSTPQGASLATIFVLRSSFFLLFALTRYTRLTVFELDQSTIITLAAVAAGALVAVLVAVARSQARRQFERLAPAFELGTAHRVGLVPPSVEGLFQGYTFRYTVEARSQYSAGGALLRTRVSSPLEWSASLQDAGSRLLVSVGILKDMDIGDDELDRRLRFAASDPSSLKALLGQTRTREALRALAAGQGFASVQIRPQRVDLKWAPRQPELDEDPDALRGRMAAAVTLLSACGYPPHMG